MGDSEIWILNSTAIPQADRVERALEYAVLTWHDELSLRDLLFQGRDALYYRSAAQLLGLVDGRGQPTELVAKFCDADGDPLELLRECFEHSAVGLGWARWAQTPLWRVDEESAEKFLAATTELSEATRARRAKSLRAWLTSLRPEAVEETPTIELLRGRLLSRAIHSFDLSNRCFNVFRREQITTVREAVAIGRSGLLELRAFGAGCARELDAALREQPPGEGIDELHRALVDGEVRFEDGDALVIERVTDSNPVEVLGFDPAEIGDVVQLWHAVVGNLAERERLVIQRRSGSLGTGETLVQIGQALGVSRERVRQLEAHAIELLRAAPGWLEVIDERLQALRGEASFVWLSQLEEAPYFAPLTERPALLQFLVRRLLAPRWVDYAWGEDDLILTREREREPMQLFEQLRERAVAHAWPAPWSELVGLVDEQLRGSDAEDLRPLLLEQLRAQAILDDEEQPTRVLGIGSSRDAMIRAVLAQSPEPIAVAELHRRFGRGRIPAECVYVRRGFVTLAGHFEGFDRWQERLVPEVERIMAGEDPGLQWMSSDLFEALSERSRLPEWLTPMILAGMLRRSGGFDDLGRQRFAIKGSSSGERVQLVPAVVEILESAGGPMVEEELFEALGRKTKVLAGTATLLRTMVPMFPLGDGRIGLIERDLPGGSAALREAEELLETELRSSNRGLTMHQALELVRPLSAAHGEWTESMVAVVPRVSVTLMSNRFAVGLESWEDCRVPTNADLLRDLLDQGDGATTVEQLQAAIVRAHGRAAARGSLVGIANSIGAKVRGEWVLSREVEEEPVVVVEEVVAEGVAEGVAEPVVAEAEAVVVAEPVVAEPIVAKPVVIELPTVTELGIPRVGRQLFTRLSHEQVGDWDALLARCAEHAAEFERRLASNEFLPVEDARNILSTLRVLVGRVRDQGSALAQRLVWILGRYFEIADDGELDFAIGGLDDDVQVFNAVLGYLGFAELEIAYS